MPFFAVICSSLCWTTSTQIFSHVGQRLSIFRMNLYKSGFSLILFLIAASLTGPLKAPLYTIGLLLLSGTLGFALGDLFLFKSFTKMGPARTLMIQSFEPLLIALFSFLLLGTQLNGKQYFGLIFLLFCLVCLSLDKKQKRKFGWRIVPVAIIGIALDGFGVVISKMAFMSHPELTSLQANVYRIAVSVVVMMILTKLRGRPLGFADIPKKSLGHLFLGSFFGTFMALGLYLYAISKLHPSVVSGIAGLTPLYASAYEHARDRIWPSPAFVLAIGFMGIGLGFLLGIF